MQMLGKHLLSAGDLDRAQALMILDTTAELASVTERSVKKLPTLRRITRSFISGMSCIIAFSNSCCFVSRAISFWETIP